MRALSLSMWCRAVGACLLTLLAGCGGVPFSVQAERFDEPDPENRKYRIVSTHPTLAATDPDIIRAADYVRVALAKQAYYEVQAGERAGMVVEISFDQSPPRVATHVTVQDVYETVPEQIVTDTKKTRQPDGTVVKEKVNRTIPEHSAKVGTSTTVSTVTLFPKSLRITGRDTPESAPGGKVRRLWYVEVRNEDQVDDFESYLLLMVAAAMDYLGENLSGEVVVLVKRGDERTQIVLSGITGPPVQTVTPVASR